ncbi:uncharacterized protein [Rutidosis leptorrhynchoides]|uniref:uncharacterized protein n=1 Tax=Rutidosis leptorrhynchoides TaxID=125765 RepID=UPI003A99260E
MYASATGSLMLFQTLVNSLIPTPIRNYIYTRIRSLLFTNSQALTLAFDQYIDETLSIFGTNEVYQAAESYLSTKLNPNNTEKLKVVKTLHMEKMSYQLDKGEQIIDVYQGIKLNWIYACEEPEKNDLNLQLTLSGLLNFIDGLWSSCGDERIVVFTTNHKEKLDPVLLRPGRMDMHIHMSYIKAQGFRTLAFNYLDVKEHPLIGEIQGLLEDIEITPAQVAEVLMKIEDADMALQGIVNVLKRKRDEDEEESQDGKKMKGEINK